MTKGYNRRKKVLIWTAEILVFVLVYLGVRAWLQQDMAEGPVPAIDAVWLDGSDVDMQRFREGPMLVYFWASWCGICKLQQGAIDAVSEDWPVVTIAMQSGNDEDIRHYLEEQGLDWAVIPDSDGSIAQRYGVRGVPASFIVDNSGHIRFHEAGFTTGLGLRARLWAAQRGL